MIDFARIRLTLFQRGGKAGPVMSVAQSSPPHRAVVEHLVRQAVYARLGRPLPRAAAAPNPLVVREMMAECRRVAEAVGREI